MVCDTLLFLLLTTWVTLLPSELHACGPAPRDGVCRNGQNSSYDGPVDPISSGSCEYNHSICKFQQGCADDDALRWSLNSSGGYTEMGGQNGCGYRYSVLESPVLNIRHLSCVMFNYSRVSPSQIAVFLANSSGAITLLPQTDNTHPPDRVVFHEEKTVNRMHGKLKFRGFSGGGPGYVRVHSVSIQLGGCEDPACRFDEDFCDWENHNWIQHQGLDAGNVKYVALQNNQPNGTLLTHLARSTEGKRNCIEFLYKISGTNDTLAVFVKPLSGQRALVWKVHANGSVPRDWLVATIPIHTNTAFQIYVEATRNTIANEIAIDRVRYTRNPNSNCPFSPQEASVNSPNTGTGIQITSTITSSESVSTGKTSGTTDAQAPLKKDENGGDEGNSSVAAIVGSVVAVIVVIAVVVTVVVIWRRKSKPESGAAEGRKDPTDKDVKDRHGDSNGVNYSYVSDTTLHTDIDPYELAEDGAPGKTRFPAGDEYNVLDVHGAGKKLPISQGAGHDVYSHINNQPVESDVGALYSQVQKKGKGVVGKERLNPELDQGAVYSQVQKKGKAVPVQTLPDAGPDLGAVYSQVQKKGKKPAISQKPTVTQKPAIAKKPTVTDDYNRIDFSEPKSSVANNAQDGELDMYNRLDEVNI